MAPLLDIKLDVVLDSTKTYYPGDTISGKIFLLSNATYKANNIRLAWTGRIQVQPVQSNKETRNYFDECWKPVLITKTNNKVTKSGLSSSVSLFDTQLVPVQQSLETEASLDLSKNKWIALAFQVTVPNKPLPSSTSPEATLNKIVYLLEAFIEAPNRPVFFGQRIVPVQEALYTKIPDMMKPQRAEQAFMVYSQQREFTSAMRVTLPCKACQPGIAIPVSISIWNNMEFSRKQGISISLFRVSQVLANGRAYTSPGEKLHRIVIDLNITETDSSQQKVQTVRIGLPIPKGTTPTISLTQSLLLSISYFIRVQVFAQEGIYTTAEGTKSQFMMVDLPFVIGTLSTPPNTPITSPVPSSPRSLQMERSHSSSTTSSNEKKKLFSDMFRNSSSGSNKKSVFSSLRLYGKKEGSTIGSREEEEEDDTIVVSPAVTMSPQQEPMKQKEQEALTTEDKEEALAVVTQNIPSTTTTSTSTITNDRQEKVFNMFADSDSEEEPEEQITATTSIPNQQTSNVFKMFEDSDSDDEEISQLSISTR